MHTVAGDGVDAHMGEGTDVVVGAEVAAVDLAGVDGGAFVHGAVLDEGVGADDAACADGGLAAQDGACEDDAPGAMTTSEPISTLRLRMSTPFAMWRSSTSSRWASAASSFAFAAASADVSIFCIEKNLLQNRLSQKLCRPLRKRKCCIQDRRNSGRWKTNKNGSEFNG